MTYRPSYAARILACPPSAVLPGVDTASTFANEGTAAHSLIEMAFRLELAPGDFLGELIDVLNDDGVTIEQFEVTQEMVDAVTVFLDRSKAIEKSYIEQVFVDYQALTEKRLESVKLKSLDFGGTIDRLFVSDDPETPTAHLLDYKHGAGVKVETEDNAQLKSYALLVFENFELVETVAAEIVQPRVERSANDPPSYLTLTRADALSFADEVLAAAQIAREYLDDPDTALLNPSAAACRWCPAKMNCPALGRSANELIVQPLSLTNLDAAKLGKLLDLAPMLIDKAKELARSKILAGETVPGWKMVTSQTRRQLTADAEAVLKKKKIRKTVSHVSKLKSPAQLEKAGVDEKIVASISYKPTGGLTLVPMSDRRAPVKRPRAVDVFTKEK